MAPITHPDAQVSYEPTQTDTTCRAWRCAASATQERVIHFRGLVVPTGFFCDDHAAERAAEDGVGSA